MNNESNNTNGSVFQKLEYDDALDIMQNYGYSSASVHPYIYQNGDDLGICYKYVDADYGTIGLQKPPTAQNYAIGCKAKTITGKPVNASQFTRGYVEGQNQDGLTPQSLYEAQLNVRHNLSPTNQTATPAKPDWSSMPAEAIHVFTMDGREVPYSEITLSAYHGILIVHAFYNGTVYTKKIIQ